MEKCSFRTDEAFCNWRIRRIMERRRRHLECPRYRGGCLVVQGRTCEMDLVPTWLKRQGRVKVLKSVGNEGLFYFSITAYYKYPRGRKEDTDKCLQFSSTD
jgi:hypothetical protein